MPVSPEDLGRVHDFLQGLKDDRDAALRRTLIQQGVITAGLAAWIAYRKFGQGR
jgi:hypothetical protein